MMIFKNTIKQQESELVQHPYSTVNFKIFATALLYSIFWKMRDVYLFKYSTTFLAAVFPLKYAGGIP